MEYRALNSRSLLTSVNKDVGTGRCRLSPEQFKLFSVNIGWILRLSLSSPGCDDEMEVLCTAWPDASSYRLDEGVICVDDTVQFETCKQWSKPDWIECICKIVQVFPPSCCTSLRMSLAYDQYHCGTGSTSSIIGLSKGKRQHHAAAFSGLPVAAGVVVRATGKARIYNATISSINALGPVSVINLGTIIFPVTTIVRGSSTLHELARPQITDNSNNIGLVSSTTGSTDEEDFQPISNTKVVNELIETVVYPALYLNPSIHQNGVLLLGPPGVGKTFAMKALKSCCKGFCKISIKEINITEILAAENPIRVLKTLMPLRTSLVKHMRDGMSPAADPKTPSKVFCSSATATATLYSPVTPQVSHTPSTPAAAPSSSSSSIPRGLTGTGTPSTPYKWNFGPPASSCKTVDNTHKSDYGRAKEGSSGAVSAELPTLMILAIDEIDALGLPESHTVVQAAIKQYLCSWFDTSSDSPENSDNDPPAASGAHPCSYCVIATTNRPADVDPRLRRGGRLEREIEVSGCKADRVKLLTTLLAALSSRLGGQLGDATQGGAIECVASNIADRTGGYVAADMTALLSEVQRLMAKGSVTLSAVAEHGSDNYRSISSAYRTESAHFRGNENSGSSSSRCKGENQSSVVKISSEESHSIQIQDLLMRAFERAMTVVTPSCLRGLTTQLPDLSYDDVIGCVEVKKSLRRILSFSSPDMRSRVKRFGLKCPGGAILYGPPGNSKTRLILAAAAHHGLPVISLSSADVYSPYVGDAEAEIRKAFRVARQASPCVLFLDELDALVTNREGATGSGVSVEARVLATLLTEMDGISSGGEHELGSVENNVIVMAATNRIDCIDAALLRKGRFHQTLFVPLPSAEEKELLLRYFSKRCKLESEDFERILKSPGFNRNGMSGADIENICREAVISNLKIKDRRNE